MTGFCDWFFCDRYFEWEPDDASGVLDEGGKQRYGERDEFCAV
jgi:hypothetical protein